jgi:anti-sigma factor RsiW
VVDGIRMTRLRRRREMACQELAELVTAHLDGALSPRDRARFEAHLAECDSCTELVAQFRHTVAALEALGGDAPEPARVAQLLELFRARVASH